MSSRVGSKVDRLLRAWGFGENVVQKFQEEEIDEEAFDCLDRRLIEILFKTVGAQAKFLKHYQAYLVDKQTSSSEVTELKSEVRVKTESEDPDDSSDPGLITGDSPGPSHQSYESNSVNVGNGRPSQEHSPEEEVLEDTPYHVPEMVMSPEGSPQYVQAAGSYGKRSYPFGVSYENDGSKRVAMGSDKDENEQDMDVDWSRFPACPFSAEWYESCIPKTWPDDLQIAIEKNRLTSTQRNEIIRRIVDRMLGEGLRGDAHYKAVADVAISRFPCLGSHLTGNLGLVNQLRACAKNKVYQAKRRAKKEAGLLVESKKTPPVKRTVKLSEVVENGKPINVVIDESTGDLVLDESEYDVSEALLVLSGDSPSKGNYYSRENTSECQSQSAESELTHHPRNGNLRSALRSSDSKRSRASPPTSREQWLDSCIPKSWAEDLQVAIEKGSLASNQKNEIVRRIVDRMIDEGLRGDPTFRDVATLAIARIPALGSKLIPGTLGLVHQLKTCYKNKTHHARRRALKEAETPVPGESPTTPAPTAVKSSLQQCRKARLSEAKTCSATEHLSRFPVLQEPEMILWEFEEIVHYKVDDLRTRWQTALPKIQRLLLQTPDPTSSYSHDKATISVLLQIEEYFSSKRKTKKAPTRKILQMCQSANRKECLPSAIDPPSLIAFYDGDKDAVPQVTTYLNNIPVFTGGAVDAFLLLTALYWVFSFDFASNCRPTMTFLFAVLMPTLMTSDIAKYRSVLTALEEVDKP